MYFDVCVHHLGSNILIPLGSYSKGIRYFLMILNTEYLRTYSKIKAEIN